MTVGAQTSELVDLSLWTEMGYAGDGSSGDWQVSDDGLRVTQHINGNPTFYVSDFDLIDSRFAGSFRVNSRRQDDDFSGWDDDFIGFVFGFQGLGENLEYYLFTWKKIYQDSAEEGFKLLKVDGVPSDGIKVDKNGEIWVGENSQHIKVLASQLGSGNGWAYDHDYSFRLSYKSNGDIQIIILDTETNSVLWNTTLITDPEPLGSGRIGFFNYSQENVTYSGFTRAIMQPPVAVPGDPYIFDETTTSITLDATGSYDPDGEQSGFDAIVSLQWDIGNDGITDDQGRTKPLENITLQELRAKGLAVGTDVPVALTVTDKDGMKDTDIGMIRYEISEPDLNRGLVAYYPFNGNANDESGNGNHGTVHGSALAPDRFEKPDSAYSFDGADDYIDLGNMEYLSKDSFSISFWVKKYSDNKEFGFIGKWDVSWHPANSFRIYNGQKSWIDYPSFAIYSPGDTKDTYININSSVKLEKDKFTNIVVIWDKSSGPKMYMDGQMVASDSNDQGKEMMTGIFDYTAKIGDWGGDWCNTSPQEDGYDHECKFEGILDDIRIYNRSLSEAEIQMLYQPGNNLTANFTADKIAGIMPLTVQFTDQSAGNVTSWQWDFDNDGVTDSEEQNPSRTYDLPGTYTVSLTVSDGTGENTETKTDYINVSSEEEKTSYYGKILNVTPANSDGSQNIQISGQAVDRATGKPLSEVPLNVVVSLDGFERTSRVFTDDTGNFHSTYFPKSEEYGVYNVRAVHPDTDEKPVQGEFAISRLVITPESVNLNIPRNYEKKMTINVEAGGAEFHNLRLTYDTLPKGVHVTAGSPVAVLASGESAELDFTLWADNMAYDSGEIILDLRSDEKDSWGTVTISLLLSEAEPALFVTPDHLKTGLALNEMALETLVLENRGMISLNDVTLSLVKEDKTTPAPAWVHLSSDENQGSIEVGEKREISISLTATANKSQVSANESQVSTNESQVSANESQVSEGMYYFYLRIGSSNYPVTDILVSVSVNQSGKGNVRFRVEDIYTGTVDPNTNEKIQGLAGAEIRVQNEKVLSIDHTLITDSIGDALFTDLPTGRYKCRLSAENHQEYIGRVWIKPGITVTEDVFLDYALVTVEWEVLETTIQDKYDIVLSATYETDVPAPVVVAEPASISIPDNMQVGDVLTGEIRYTNYGLIRADNLRFAFPQDDEYFEYDIFANGLPDSLDAKEFVTVPYRITCVQSFPVQSGGKRDASQAKGKRSDDCFSYSKCWGLIFNFWCANGDLSDDSAYTCTGVGYGECSGSPVEWGTWVAQGGQGRSVPFRSFEPIKGVLCPPDDPCPKDDLCCRMGNGSSEPAGSEVDLFVGEYRDEVTDLSVKVPGYLLEVRRSYYDYEWHFNDLKENLDVEYDRDGTVKHIRKHGVTYKKADEAGTVYEFDETRRIFREEEGYRWKDGSGNWKLYASDGRILSYGNRNNQKVSYIYDDGKITGLADSSGDQVLWYEHTGNFITKVNDAHGRIVQYEYSGGRLSKVTDALGNEWHYDYNVWGGLLSRQDPEGYVTTIRYSSSMYVESVEFADGSSKIFDYSYDSGAKERYASVTYDTGKIKEVWFNEDGKKIRTDINGRTVEKIIYEGRNEIHIDANGNETRREFDEWRNLKREIYPDGSSVTYQYESKFNNKLRITDERGVVTKYEYDDSGNREKKIEAYGTPDERIIEYAYDEAGNLITEKVVEDVRTADAVTTMDYDDNGNMISVTDPEGSTTTYTYNAMGQVLTKTDPREKVWTYGYDDAGNLKSMTDPLNHVTQYVYDAVGNRIQETDPEGNVTLYEYNYAGRIKKTTDALNNSAIFEYNADGNLVKRSDQEGKEIRQEYDADGRLAKTVDGNGNEIAYEYQDTPGSSCQTCSGGAGADQPAKITYPTFAKTFQYDERGRKHTEIDVLSETEQYLTRLEYDPAGNVISQTDKENHTTSYRYDKLGRKISATDAINGVTEYVYDDRNNLISLKDANGNITWFEYDRNNRMTKEIRPMGEETVYEYDGAGNLIRKTDAKNQKTEYGYDDAGRMTEIRYYAASDQSSPQKTVTFAYHPAGTLKSYTDGMTSASYEYDALRRKISETVNYGAFELSFSYTYHKNGLKKSFTGPDGITYEYTYDSNNQLTGISIPGSGIITYDSYQWNRPLSVSYPGGVKKAYGYDPLMRVSSITVKDSVQKVLMDYQYAYDKMNNILSKQTEHGDYSYTYDPLYQLKTADNAVLDNEEYAYDKVGNRLTSADVSGNWTYKDNNELVSYDDYTFDYDANGNMIKKSGNGEVF